MGEKCPLCATELEAVTGEQYQFCPRCRTRVRFRGEELEALDIPSYHARLAELEGRNAELTGMIEQEGGKGASRDQALLQSFHLERQRVLSEYGFLSYFSRYQEKWKDS
jgi:Zn-finger nucleic acid-binding protein